MAPTQHLVTTSDDFRFDNRTVTLPRNAFAAIAEQIAEYQQYAEEMRSIGRGFSPCSPFSPGVTLAILRSALAGDGQPNTGLRATMADIIITVATGRAFSGSSQWGYRARVEPDGTVWVWDDVSDTWTICHALTPAQLRYVRARARMEAGGVR